MSIIYANSVGIITKDIYIIKNKINEKTYVGQSINAEQRFLQHCKNNKSLIGKEILEYGKENFIFKILEKQIENYNEREKYWISYYNTIFPFGYNLTSGGENPPVLKGCDHPNSNLKKETLEQIFYDLEFSKDSLSKIAEKYKTSKRIVLGINKAERYFISNKDYPIRKNPNPIGKIKNEILTEIKFLLEENYLMDREIAELYDLEYHAIQRINHGQCFYDKNITYPIRKYKIPANRLEPEVVDEIIDLIINTSLSLREIGRIYNKTHSIIINIKNGSSKIYYRNYLNYPLRPNN